MSESATVEKKQSAPRRSNEAKVAESIRNLTINQIDNLALILTGADVRAARLLRDALSAELTKRPT